MSTLSEVSTPTRRLSLAALILTSTFALGVNMVWLSYNIFILPVQVQAVSSESTKGIVLGTLVGLAIGVAVIVNIVAGILSDHASSRFGRRRPTLLWGTALFAANLQAVAYMLIAALYLLMTLVNVLAMSPYDTPIRDMPAIRLGAAIVETFRVQRRVGMASFWWFVLGSFLIYMGVSGFQFFGVYYLEGILHITNPDDLAHAVQITGLLNLVISVIFALVAGMLSDKLGRRNIIIVSVLVASAIGIFFPFARSLTIFLAFSAFYGAANGVILSVDTALTSDLVPIDEAGKYMAYANLAVGVANGVAPPIFGLILNFQGAPTLTSFIIFFVLSAVFFVVSSIVMALKVPSK